MPTEALGLLHLGDLQTGYPWSSSQLAEVLTVFGWAPGTTAVSRWDPPPRLAVVVPGHLGVEHVARHRTWFRRARHITLIQDISGDDLAGDPELAEALAHERGLLGEALGRDREVVVVDWDRTPPSTHALLEHLTAGGLAPLDSSPIAAVPPGRAPAGPAGRWIDWTGRGDGGLAGIARTVCMAEDRPAILDTAAEPAVLVGLRDGMALTEIEPIEHQAALAPDGEIVLGHSAAGLTVGPLFGARRRVPVARLGPIMVDPALRLGAAGGRCWFHWLCVDDGEASVALPVVHDWPCGHGKKLWGYMDNDPVRVEVARQRDAYVSVYDVDAIVGGHIMPRWQPAGPAWAPLWPTHDPARALYTCPDWTRAGDTAEAEALHDEDCRADAPAIALGPDPEHRYALGLDREVWRIIGDDAVRIAGPDEGYAVLDASHRIVRRADGRLLCGSEAWLFVEDDGVVWREDIRTGARSPRCDVDREIDTAVPIVGAGHAVLVHCEPTPGHTEGDDSSPVVRRVPFFCDRFSIRVV